MPKIGEVVGGARDFAKYEFQKHTIKSTAIALLGGFTVKRLYHDIERIEEVLIDKKDAWLWARQDRSQAEELPVALDAEWEKLQAEFIPALAEEGNR